MAPLKVGDSFPDGVKFEYVPYQGNDDPTVCGMPAEYDASKEFKGKKVVLVSTPGAFTPGCQANHIPPYIKHLEELRNKGVDLVVVIAFNDAWVMNAWAKVNHVKDNILFMSDSKTHFAKEYGWMAGVADRTGRFAMVIDKDGKVAYSDVEKDFTKVTVSGAEAVMSKI